MRFYGRSSSFQRSGLPGSARSHRQWDYRPRNWTPRCRRRWLMNNSWGDKRPYFGACRQPLRDSKPEASRTGRRKPRLTRFFGTRLAQESVDLIWASWPTKWPSISVNRITLVIFEWRLTSVFPKSCFLAHNLRQKPFRDQCDKVQLNTQHFCCSWWRENIITSVVDLFHLTQWLSWSTLTTGLCKCFKIIQANVFPVTLKRE